MNFNDLTRGYRCESVHHSTSAAIAGYMPDATEHLLYIIITETATVSAADAEVNVGLPLPVPLSPGRGLLL